MKKLPLVLLLLVSTSLFSNSSYYEYGKKIEVTPYVPKKSLSLFPDVADNNISIKYYKNSSSQIVGVDNTIIAKCNNVELCKSVILKYSTLEFQEISKNTYLIKIAKEDDIFEISSRLYEENCFSYVHPNFYKEKISR